MAVTPVAPVLAVNALANQANQYVMGFVDAAGISSKLFTQTGASGGSNGTNPTWAAVTPAALGGLPTISAVTVVTASDGNSGGVNGGQSDNAGVNQAGYVKITLAPNAADVVNASSPMTYTLSPNAFILLSSAAS